MNIIEAMQQRHSVRQYKDEPISAEAAAAIREEIEACNRESGLAIRLITDEPKAFSGFMAHYGKFSGVKNYIALIGPKGPELEEKCGYYGERLALLAQQLGLNTCWVALTYKKVPEALGIKAGEKLNVVISLGYGENQGEPHKSKTPQQVSNVSGASPEWFKAGVEAALLAPTAMNQQKFFLTYGDGKAPASAREGTAADSAKDVTATVSAKAGSGFYTKTDLGIVKYHFETAAGRENFKWI